MRKWLLLKGVLLAGTGTTLVRGDQVPVREYVDRRVEDLARYHNRDTDGLQAEIDRRIGEVQRETISRIRETAAAADSDITALGKRIDTLLGRVERAEAALERQRGRTAAYATVSAVLITAVTVLTLVLDHVHL